MGPVGGIGCLVPRSGPNLALFESCGAMHGESCAIHTHIKPYLPYYKGTYDDWLAEMAGDRLIIERFANITDGSVIGVRAPYLRIGGNTQFQMMNDQFFVYDSTIATPLSRIPGINFVSIFFSCFPCTLAMRINTSSVSENHNLTVIF